MRIILFIALLSGNLAFGQEDNSVQYVARFAMQTAKSKNFQELAENLFPQEAERREVLKFLKKEGLLKRSLPDVMVEGSIITIKERSKMTSLDLSEVHSKKLIFNGKKIPFDGKEDFKQIYLTFKKLHSKKWSDRWLSFFIREAHADLPILAVVTLTSYAKASIAAHAEDVALAAAKSANRTRMPTMRSVGHQK